MHLFKLTEWCFIYTQPGVEHIHIDDERGSGYIYREGELHLIRYERDIRYGVINYQNELLEIRKKRCHIDSLMKDIKRGACKLIKKNGKKYDIDAMEAYALLYGRRKMLGQEKKIAASISHYPKRRDTSVIILDLETRGYKTLKCDEYSFFYVIDGACYRWLSFDDNEIVKYDSDLNEIWKYEYQGQDPRVMRPIKKYVDYKATVIFNISAVPKGKLLDDLAAQGELSSLSKEDGSVNWHRTFPIQVDDCQRLTEDTLVLFSGNELFVLDGDSGETVSVIPTGLNMQTTSVFIIVMSPHVYLFSKAENVLQIYDIESMDCLRQIEGTECGGNFYYEPKMVGGKLFVPLGAGSYCSPLLVIDGDDIYSPIEHEVEPEFCISTPDADNPAIIMEVNHPCLGDVLRLAEIYALEHAEKQGNEGRRLGSNPHFDGRVILKYSGCIADRKEAIEKLDILKERFDFYAQDSVYICRSGDGSRYATLEYELESECEIGVRSQYLLI